MKPETGNNLPKKKYNVSVQLVLDGHSSSFILPSVTSDKHVSITVLTEKVTLVPWELFNPDEASEYILKSGISIDRNETIIQGEVHDGIIAVMALKEDFVNMIMDKYCGNVSFTSPLMPQKEERKYDIYATVTDHELYMKAYNEERLIRAEAVRILRPEDASYFILSYMEILYKQKKCSIAINCTKELRHEFRCLAGKVKFFNPKS